MPCFALFCLVNLVYFVSKAAVRWGRKLSTSTLTKILYNVLANISVSKIWNIGIGGQSNIGK